MTIKLLSDGFPVVAHHEGREFPGLLIQGDTLFTWLQTARDARVNDDVGALDDLIETLEGYLDVYERVLLENSMRAPYERH